jgi:L-amino acid N-acyltransferase YncA
VARLERQLIVRAAEPGDAEAIAFIYNQGIEDRVATFETGRRSGEDRRRWLKEQHDEKHPVIVAVVTGAEDIVGWGSISAISARTCYSGVGEYSVYVRRDSRGKGVGATLIASLIERATTLGYWKLIGRIFSYNGTSIRLAKRYGFREVGVLEKHSKLDGKWVDLVEVERLIQENID